MKKYGFKVFVLLDTDWYNWYSQNDIDLIKSYLEEENFMEVLFSNKDIEIFILLHLKFYNWYWENKDYKKMIREYYSDYYKWCSEKLKNIHKDIIQNRLDDFKHNIEKLKEIYKNEWTVWIKNMTPFTEVYKIIKELEK